jgi:hypothetical protein
MDNSSNSIKCAKPWCKRLLSPETRLKACVQCLERHRVDVRAYFARKNAQPVAGKKRVRTSEEIPDRPSQRLKADCNYQESDENRVLVLENENDDKVSFLHPLNQNIEY